MLRNEVGWGEQSSTTGAEVATKPTALMAAGGRHSGGGGEGLLPAFQAHTPINTLFCF